jgi:hypothetical protein
LSFTTIGAHSRCDTATVSTTLSLSLWLATDLQRDAHGGRIELLHDVADALNELHLVAQRQRAGQ